MSEMPKAKGKSTKIRPMLINQVFSSMFRFLIPLLAGGAGALLGKIGGIIGGLISRGKKRHPHPTGKKPKGTIQFYICI